MLTESRLAATRSGARNFEIYQRGNVMRTNWAFRWLAVLVVMGFVAFRLTQPRLSADEAPKAKAEKNHAIQAVSHLYDGIRTETLPNGLTVYLKSIPEQPILTTLVAYTVGPCDA